MQSLVNSVIISFLVMLSSCVWDGGRIGLRGEGPVVERKLSLEKIKGISLPGSAKVYLTQGSNQEVRITGQENIIDNLNLDVTGEVWQIANKRPVWQSETLKIYLKVETIRLIKIAGSGEIEFLNHFSEMEDLEIRISGSGKVKLDMDAGDIDARISGSGDLIMKGSARFIDIDITGSGSVRAYDMNTRKADVRISGSGGMQLSVEDRLDARITGSGSISYQGDPRVHSSITGSGSVRER
jgi:hypothetical protein